MRTEEGWDEAERDRVGEPADDPQRLQLVVDREAVAALDLDRRRAVRREATEARQGEREEVVLDRKSTRLNSSH